MKKSIGITIALGVYGMSMWLMGVLSGKADERSNHYKHYVEGWCNGYEARGLNDKIKSELRKQREERRLVIVKKDEEA